MMDGLPVGGAPPAATVGGALASAGASGLRFLWHGATMVGRDVYDERLRICAECPQHMTTLGVRRCRVCKCVLAAKAAFPHESCPVGLWPAVAAARAEGCGGCGR